MNDITRIADHYGLHHQLGKLLEELGELEEAADLAYTESRYTTELSDGITERLVDELADVAIMIEQIAYLTGTQAALHNRIGFKIDRQLGRMEDERKQICVNKFHQNEGAT